MRGEHTRAQSIDVIYEHIIVEHMHTVMFHCIWSVEVEGNRRAANLENYLLIAQYGL